MRSGCVFFRISSGLGLLIVTLALATTLASAAECAPASAAAEEKLQSIVSDLCRADGSLDHVGEAARRSERSVLVVS